MRRAWVVAFALGVVPGCAKDVVLPDIDAGASQCGDGVVEPGEECDALMSPGCIRCVVAPGWACPNNMCSPLCGDGVIGAGNDCSTPKRDTDCDMTGYWAARETDYTVDTVVRGLQTSSSWSLYHFEQTRADFHVVESLECGVHTTGTATVEYTPASLRAVLYLNRADGGPPPDGGAPLHPARHGTSKLVNGGCAVTFDRWYRIFGALDSYSPVDFSTRPPLSTLVPLPSVKDPTGTEWPAGATDPDGDGIPGIAFHVTGILPGTRNAAERQWKEYATKPAAPVAAAALTFAVPGGFDDQESVLRVTDCGSRQACQLIAAGANVPPDYPSHVTFAFLGKTFGSARVAPVVKGVPRQNVDADLATCAIVRTVLPHDQSMPILDAGPTSD